MPTTKPAPRMKLNLTNGESIPRNHPDFLPPGDANFRITRNGKQIRARVKVCGSIAPEFPYYRCSRHPNHGDDCAAHGGGGGGRGGDIGERAVVMFARWERARVVVKEEEGVSTTGCDESCGCGVEHGQTKA